MVCVIYNRVGQFLLKNILNKSTPGIYSFLCKSSENRRKIVEVTIGWRKGHDLLGRYLIKVENFFLRTQPCHTSKEAEYYVDF
jgi:hypothetical protein